MKSQTLCHLLSGRRIILKKAERGVSNGKWNAPGGNIEANESPEECAVREVFEETGLKVKELFYHGVMDFHLNGGEDISFRVHLFSTRSISGEVKSSEEGEVRWFDFESIPISEMWDDDIYWLHHMLKKRKFDAEFYFDKENKKVVRYSMAMK